MKFLLAHLRHYAVPCACWVFLSIFYSGAQRVPLQNLLWLQNFLVLLTLQFFTLKIQIYFKSQH